MKINNNFSLKNYNTFGIEAKAKQFVDVTSTEELKTILQQYEGEKKLILGGGSNMLLTAKRMFKRHLEEVVAEFEGTHKEAQSELARLTEFVARLTGPEAKA